MKNAKSAIAVAVMALMVVPAAHAKKKNSNANSQLSAVSQPGAASNNGASPQAGGLPATNVRVTALEGAVSALQAAVAVLRADLNAEIAARQAADAALTNALNAEIAARQAADTALANELAAIPRVFATDGAASNIKAATVTVASKALPAGTYLLQAAVQMVNSQNSGDANARCVMRADGNLVADTSDLEFPVLASTGGSPNVTLGSTIFAPLQGSYSSTSPISVIVECTESNGDNGGLDALVNIAALKVGTLQ